MVEDLTVPGEPSTCSSNYIWTLILLLRLSLFSMSPISLRRPLLHVDKGFRRLTSILRFRSGSGRLVNSSP